MHAETELIEGILQGYWRIDDDTYLLIDESIFQIVDLGAKPIAEHFKCSDTKIKHRTSTSDMHIFDVELTRSQGKNKKSKMPDNLIIELFPIAGVLVLRSDSGEILRATRDNEMSIAHFASH